MKKRATKPTAHHYRCMTCGTVNGHHMSCEVAELLKIIRDLLEYSGHLPIFGSDPSVKNVRLAAKFVGACDRARAALKTKAGVS